MTKTENRTAIKIELDSDGNILVTIERRSSQVEQAKWTDTTAADQVWETKTITARIDQIEFFRLIKPISAQFAKGHRDGIGDKMPELLEGMKTDKTISDSENDRKKL